MLFLRSLVFSTVQFITTVIFSLVGVLLWPLPFSWRYKIVSKWAALNLWLLKLICGISYELEGVENIPDEPCIIMCKHQSAWETLALQVIFPQQVWVLKRELLWIPFFGWGLAALNPIAIDRSAGRKALKQIIEQGKNRLQAGSFIVIFPEGTRIPVGEMGRFGIGGAKLAVESDVDLGAMHAGEISGLITDIKSTREIIEDIVLGYSNDNYECAKDNEVIDTEVSKYLKHKPPILLVEKILDLEPGIECKASLKLSKDKWFFKCHYPDYPVMPGTLLLEAMSQTMTLVVTSMDEFSDEWGGLLLLSSINNVKFKKEALPGLELIMTAKIDSFKRGIVKGNIKCEADGEPICSCVMTIVIPNALKQLSNQIRREK